MEEETRSRIDNKVRLDRDVLEDAYAIADALGLQSPRTIIEGIFRRYAPQYIRDSGLQLGQTLFAEKRDDAER
jgi:hypothetical protein